jgi:hypothetical protein
MRKIQSFSTLFLGLVLSLGAQAQDAESILAKAREMQLARWEGVDSYTVEQTVAGTNILMDYLRVDETSFRVVPKVNMAGITESSGDGAIADFDDIQKLAQTAEFLGTEPVGDRKGFHLKADNVEHQQVTGDQTIDFKTFEIWIDTTDYVPLRMLIHGTATGPEGARPIVVEKVDTDYRHVAGSNLYEAYRQVMTMSGVIDPEQQKELQEAQKQMAEMEKQLASMPEAQRKMMERMMGPKMEMMKKMASGGGIEVVSETLEIRVNTAAE